jgi:hypothetical protein
MNRAQIAFPQHTASPPDYPLLPPDDSFGRDSTLRPINNPPASDGSSCPVDVRQIWGGRCISRTMKLKGAGSWSL